MKTRHLVDPALEAFLEAPPLAITMETLPAVREGLKQLYASFLGEGDAEVTVAEHLVPAPPARRTSGSMSTPRRAPRRRVRRCSTSTAAATSWAMRP